MRIVLGEPAADDLAEYFEQLKRTEALLQFGRDFLAAAIGKTFEE